MNQIKKLPLFLLLVWMPFHFAFAGIFGWGSKKGIIPFPGGSNKIIYYYYEKDGKKIPNGKYSEYFPNGTLFKTLHYKDGHLNGKAIEYYGSSKKKIQGHYKNDIRVGKWTMWRDDGTKTMESVFNDKGEMETMMHFHSNGKKKSKEYYHGANVYRLQVWDIQGRLLSDRTAENTVI